MTGLFDIYPNIQNRSSAMKIYFRIEIMSTLRNLSVALFGLLTVLVANAQTTFTSTGSYTVPAGVYGIKVECWGAGGGGSTRTTNGTNYGAGGGGGAYASSIITVTPGATYSIVVGTGGAANSAGGNSSFNTTTVVAAGGSSAGNNGTTGAAGGTTAASTGTTKYAGGSGGNAGVSSLSGAGGGAAGSTGAGGDASGGIAGVGTSLNGGSGASGVAAGNAGAKGSLYGGGGSGGATNSNANRAGGAGADGYVVITPVNIVEVNASLGTTTAYYGTLKQAFDKINDGTHKGVVAIKINYSTTETATAALNASGTGSASYTSVTIYPTATGLIVSGALNADLIQLNGADNVTIDGRVNLAGSADLTVTNTGTGTSASTIRLINSAQNNYIQYCNISGAGTSTTAGTVFLSTASSGTGNDNNYIQYSNISGASSGRAINAIFSLGTSGAENSENVVRNNHIYNFLNPANASNGVNISSYSTAFTISENNFYETSSFVPTASVEYAVIRLNNTSGNDFVVSDNYIGGSEVACGGTAWTKTNAFNNTFTGIYVNVGATNNSVQHNTIQNFSYANSGAALWCGIVVAGGSVNVGTLTGNVIGSTVGTNSITFTSGATDASLSGIYVSSTGTVSCMKNTIGSITTNASSATYANHFYGIYKSGVAGNIAISNNVIGSSGVSNSIAAASAATGTSQMVYGIYSQGTGSVTISSNTIANITNSTTETTLLSKTRGIFATAGANSITENTVYDIKTGGTANTQNYTNAPLIGISVIAKTEGNAHNISNNTVYNLENTTTSTTSKFESYGIYLDGPSATTSTVSRNFIKTFIVPTTSSTGSYLHGISIYDGNVVLTNNIVFLGNNISVGCSLWGIWTNSNDIFKMYYNTVYLSGTATNGTSNSYAFRSLNCPTTMDIRNNILWDGRVNSSATISHYAIYLNCTSGLTLNYNDYQYAQNFGIAGGTTYATYTAWQTAMNVSPSYNESHSLNVDPQLVNLGGGSAIDYQTTVQLQGDPALVASYTDFDNVTRQTPTMGAWEFFSNPVETWNGTTFRNSYTTLGAAFTDINNGLYTGNLTIKIRGNTTELTSAVINASGSGSANYSHILVYPTRTGIKVTGSLAAPLVDVNGADNITFDGRIDGAGTANQLTFTNSSTASTSGTSTFRFINSAQSDSIRYCNVEGASTDATAGVIFINGDSGNGNDNLVIINNNLTSVSAANRPSNLIYSVGSGSSINDGAKIQYNNLYNFFRTANTSFGINIGSGSNAFTISNNSFYETTSFTPSSAASYAAIYINNTSGGGFSISENYIGGNAANCSGTWVKNAGNSNVFYGIYLNIGSTASSLQGNVIKNINWSNTGSTSWYGVHVGAGAVNIGTTSGNTIGATTGTGSVVITNTLSGGNVIGLNISSTGTVDCRNNKIGAITTANASTNATHFYGVYKSAVAGTTTISGNTIGSASTSNSINASSASSSNAQSVYGIKSDGTGDVTISENVIANLTNGTTNSTTSTLGNINGINISAGNSNIVDKNTVRNLNIANANNTFGTTTSAIGIALTGTVANSTISGNTVYGIYNNFTNYAGAVIGIYYAGSTSGTNTVTKNFIHTVRAPNNTATNGTTVVGILAASGVTTYSNNIIYLGLVGVSGRSIVYGMYDSGVASQTCNLYFNSVYIAGTELGANNSAAIYSAANANTRDYRNNVFFNARTGGTGAHYAIYFNYTSAGTLTCNYNDYYTTGTTSYLARFNGANDNTIPFITGQDGNSVNLNPMFNSAGSTTATDYKVAITLNGIAGTGITTDYGFNARPATNPTMGAWESNSNKWKGTLSNDWNTAGNWTGNIVPAVDANVEFDAAPVNHCVMDQNRSVNNIINAQSTYRVVTNGKKLTVKGSLVFTNGAQIDATSANTEIEFAGAAQQTIPASVFYNDQVYNLTVNNGSNVLLNGTLILLNTISATSGFLDAYTNSPTFIYAGTAAQSIEDARFLDSKIYNLTIDNALGVNLNSDLTVTNNLLINSGKKLTISVTKLIKVQGLVTNNAGAAGLIIKSSQVAANGSFIFFNPTTNPVRATVEMYSKAFASTQNSTTLKYSNYKWQYFGVPFRAVVKSVYDYSYGIINPVATVKVNNVRRWVESGDSINNHWLALTSTDSVYAFKGYEITQGVAKTYTATGVLYNSNYSSGQLPYTPTALYPGQNVLGNSYTAAIDITQINFGADTEWTVYLYNSGSYNDWLSVNGESSTGTSPGQYVAVSKYLAGYAGLPATIPSMQGFLVKATSSSANATIQIPYSAAAGKNTEMQRSVRKTNVAELPQTVITVNNNTNTQSDRMWLFTNPDCTRGYDNGWDGYKSLTASTTQIYASENAGELQCDVVDDINNSVLGFYPGTDSLYTITFDHENVEDVYPQMYLIDMKTDTVLDITESGSKYTFKSFFGDAMVERFKIVTSIEGSQVTTDEKPQNNYQKPFEMYNSGDVLYVKNNTTNAGAVNIYDAGGSLISQYQFNASGVTTIKLNLNTGVYFARGENGGNNYTSRFVIK